MSREQSIRVAPGWQMLTVSLTILVAGGILLLLALAFEHWLPAVLGIGSIIAAIFLVTGFIALQPNEAVVLLLFGEYRGSLRESGFYWANPFFTKKRVS